MGKVLPEPMFLVDEAAASLSFREVCYTGKPYALIVRETRGGATKEMPRKDPAWAGRFTLFTGGEGQRPKR